MSDRDVLDMDLEDEENEEKLLNETNDANDTKDIEGLEFRYDLENTGWKFKSYIIYDILLIIIDKVKIRVERCGKSGSKSGYDVARRRPIWFFTKRISLFGP